MNCVCEQACPVPVQVLKSNVAARPLGSRHNVHKGTYLNTVEKGYRKGFVRIGQWEKSYGDDMAAKPISFCQRRSQSSSTASIQHVLYLISRNRSCSFNSRVFPVDDRRGRCDVWGFHICLLFQVCVTVVDLFKHVCAQGDGLTFNFTARL